ncbi:hypothetical protein [Mycolicibacterium cosmeticum]|uniref:hypothetical protein n=1 Tax=Mycolicibacterium cosmeticum TaxID=258533 RepID=UPI003204730F
MEDPDVILVAAVRYPWGEVVTGRRHRNVYEAMALKGLTSRDGCDEGFVGKTGTFYTREQATQVAIAARQAPRDLSGPLNSEHLWPLTPAEKNKWRDG